MRIPILLLNIISMPLTVYIYLVACTPLLLCSSMSCLILSSRPPPPLFDVCNGVLKCGSFDFAYPFGQKHSGCGDPEFQLDHCHHRDRFPLLNISGDQYRILEPSFLANDSNNNTITIINDNLWGDKCNLSGNYSQFWSSASHFHIADSYTNLTLWRQCDENKVRTLSKMRLCDDVWYYDRHAHETSFDCITHLRVPIKKFLTPTTPYYTNSTKMHIEQSFLGQGFQIKWYVDTNRYRRCGACLKSSGSCGYNISKPTTFLCYCPDGTSHLTKCPGRDIATENSIYHGNTDHRNKTTNIIGNYASDTDQRKKTAIMIGCSVVGVAVTVIALVLLSAFYAKRRKTQPPSGSSNSKVEKFLKEYACEMPTRYSQSRLRKITNNFAEKLGEGGFGVVYKGKLPNGTLVAVKLLDRQKHSQTQFMNEVATIGRIHHFNLVRLLGYCFETPSSALVYEYMVNGSLDKFIFPVKEGRRVLSWEKLYSIALGAARGIAYLHQDCDRRIIHFDIKPHNILLDADFTPKVADFGLAKLCGKEDDHISMTGARGTPGYVAPEVCDRDMGPITDKSDVYSFGVLLLEIVGGRKNFDGKVSRSSQLYFPEWAFKLLESGELGMRLRGEGEMGAEDEEKARKLTKVGLWCIQYNSRDRPCMMRVVQMLEGNESDIANPSFPINSSATPEKGTLSSTENSSSIDIRF